MQRFSIYEFCSTGKEEGIRQLILKQYKKGLTVEYISDINDIDIEYVKKVVSRLE